MRRDHGSEKTNREQNREKPWENKRREGKTTETKKTRDLCETGAALSRAKLTQSTLTDAHVHISAQFLCFTEPRCVNTG